MYSFAQKSKKKHNNQIDGERFHVFLGTNEIFANRKITNEINKSNEIYVMLWSQIKFLLK